MTITAIAPFFIVRNVPVAIAFYCDQLGFELLYEGPTADDIFFAMVTRGSAMLMIKAVGVDPQPNNTRHAWAPWDAYVVAPDPDALAAEFLSRGVTFSTPLNNTTDNLRGFELKDPDGYFLFFGTPTNTGKHTTHNG